MKTAILISCFNWYKQRLVYVEKYLKESGYVVETLCSDYNHFKKCEVEKIPECNYIHVRPYKKNLSFARMYSHYGFSKQVHKLLLEKKPDLIYGLVPPNSVAWACAQYKKQYPETKLVFDVIDMWPESYPAHKVLELPFNLWRYVRDNNLKYADHVFTECQLYQSFLKTVPSEKMSALRLCREDTAFTECPEWNGKTVNIAYLGSINFIIDISLIESLISEISKSMNVNVHIVGGGQSKDVFVDALKRANANVVDHGIIYDKDKMRSIIGGCHFAINMMKASVCVGLTIKSMDYFQMGVPLLNTIKGDTTDFIKKYRCGYNVDDPHLVAERLRLLHERDYKDMRAASQEAFIENLTLEAFSNNLKSGLKSI